MLKIPFMHACTCYTVGILCEKLKIKQESKKYLLKNIWNLIYIVLFIALFVFIFIGTLKVSFFILINNNSIFFVIIQNYNLITLL